ncbi:MAG: type II secretion system F family protein [Lachnospiraceae bacterium]|nr:type II secretion system F family protein [Lachnospiraceae bacterium]
MITYKYSAVSKDGMKVNGVIEGYNEMDAIDRIKADYDIVLKVTPMEEAKESILTRELGGTKLNNKEFTVMCSQFAIIIKSGIPIARAVTLVYEKTTDKALKKLLKKVSTDVEGGRSLAASFEENGAGLLPQTFIESIRAGEESGNLNTAFESMYEHFDKQTKIGAKVKGALMYPAFVLVLGIVVVIVMMVKVIPTFINIFDGLDAELPAITKSLIAVSTFFQHYWALLAVIAIVGFIAYKVYGNTEEGRIKLAKNSLKLPVLGNIQQLNAASQFSNTLVTMIDAGLPLTKAVSITAKALDNYYISQEVGKMTGQIEEGHTLGDAMRDSGCMPDILTDMTAVGEESGELSETLSTIAAYYDSELATAISEALAKLEPTILVVIAAFAGYVVVAIYVAMFSMYGSM